MNEIVDIDSKRLEQLRNYALWERENFPGGRVHVLDWAANEIERLREAINTDHGYLLLPQTKEQAEEFFRLAKIKASEFGVPTDAST